MTVVVLGLFGACSGENDEGAVATTTPTTPTTTSTSPTSGVVPNPSTCANQNFTPNSEDIAGNVVATGLTCAEAEAFVRKVGPLVGATGGPANISVDGFACVRTKEDDGSYGLPSSDYECTSGTRTVTFHRT